MGINIRVRYEDLNELNLLDKVRLVFISEAPIVNSVQDFKSPPQVKQIRHNRITAVLEHKQSERD